MSCIPLGGANNLWFVFTVQPQHATHTWSSAGHIRVMKLQRVRIQRASLSEVKHFLILVRGKLIGCVGAGKPLNVTYRNIYRVMHRLACPLECPLQYLQYKRTVPLVPASPHNRFDTKTRTYTSHRSTCKYLERSMLLDTACLCAASLRSLCRIARQMVHLRAPPTEKHWGEDV